jgi:hypothetical protein
MKKEKYSTQLIIIYLDNVIGLYKSKETIPGDEWSSRLDSAR